MSLKDIQSHFFSAEHYNYSNIVKLNGKDDTFILGNYYSEYTTNVIPIIQDILLLIVVKKRLI